MGFRRLPKDDLLRRCEKDSKFKSDALSLIPDADKIHPFKRQIESLKEIIEDAIKNDEPKDGWQLENYNMIRFIRYFFEISALPDLVYSKDDNGAADTD